MGLRWRDDSDDCDECSLRYNTDRGVWRREICAGGLRGVWIKAGENTMTLTVPEGDLTTGVVYDYLRLEMNEGAAAGRCCSPIPP